MFSTVLVHFTPKCKTVQIMSTLKIWKISTMTTARHISFKIHGVSLVRFVGITHK